MKYIIKRVTEDSFIDNPLKHLDHKVLSPHEIEVEFSKHAKFEDVMGILEYVFRLSLRNYKGFIVKHDEITIIDDEG